MNVEGERWENGKSLELLAELSLHRFERVNFMYIAG